MKNYYETLEVETFAPYETIKKSYKRLILLYHPDKQQQANDTFKKVIRERRKRRMGWGDRDFVPYETIKKPSCLKCE